MMTTPEEKSIERTLENRATREEARMVFRWFNTSEGKAYLSRRMDKDLEELLPGTEKESIDHPIPTEEMYQYILSRIRWQKRRKLLFRAAAILIPLFLFAGQFFYLDNRVDILNKGGYEEVYVPKGERLRIAFQDGSYVILNADSRIRYPKKFSFSERKIELEGEGYFDAVSNANRPFIVSLHGLDVKVTGTTFNIKAYPEEADYIIALETGRISLNVSSRTLAHLEPGEKASFNRKTGTCHIIKEPVVKKNSVWKENILLFENTPLEEVLKTLTRWYDVDFIVEDSTTLAYTYTLTTSKLKIREILMELEKIAPVYFIEQTDYITVRRKK